MAIVVGVPVEREWHVPFITSAALKKQVLVERTS